MPYKKERKPRGKTLETLQRNAEARGAANMMNDADDESRGSDDMVWDWSEQGRNYRRNVLNRTSLWPSWQGVQTAFEYMKKTAHGQSELSGESSDMLKIKSDGSHANGKSLTEFQVRPNLLPTTLNLATQFGIMGESQPPSRYVPDPPAWFRRPQSAVTVYDPAQRQAIDQQRLQQAHQTPDWGHQFAAGAQRNAVNFISQFFETPKGIAGIRRQDPVASYERGEQPAAAHAINESSSQQQAPAQDMGRNAAVTVQEPASILSFIEGGSSWDIVSQGVSATSRALVWLWNYGGNQTPSGGVDAAPVRTDNLDVPRAESDIDKFVRYRNFLFKMVENAKVMRFKPEVVEQMIFMMEANPDLGAFIARKTLDVKIATLTPSAPPEIADALTRLRDSLPDASKFFSRLVDMLGRKGTPEYNEDILVGLIVTSTAYSLKKSKALMQYELKHNLLHRINEFYGLQDEEVRSHLDYLLNLWNSATASLDDVTLINTLKSVFLSDRLYRQEYKVELLEAGKNAIERSPGLFGKFGVADIGKLRAAADRESIQIESRLRAFADQLELCLMPESRSTDFSIDQAGYVFDFLRSKYPKHEFSIGQESSIKIRYETGLESSSPSLLEALLTPHTVTMEFPSGTPEAIGDYIRKYQSRKLTHPEALELSTFSEQHDREEMARRIQLARNGTQESLVTEVKKMLPQYQNILDAVSARDTLVHERTDAGENLKNATCHSADPERLNIQARLHRLRKIEVSIEKEISDEIIKLENSSVHESILPPIFDFKLRDLFKRLEIHAINPKYVSSIPSLEHALVTNESLKGKLALYLVVYLANNGLPEMPKALSLLKSVWVALKNSLSSQPPTAAPSRLSRIDDELATWFNPYIHTPAEFIDQWVTLQTQQAGLTGDYRNVSVDISYKIIDKPTEGNFVPSFTQNIKEHNTTLKLREIASRQYLKKKREQGWDNFKIDWPSEFPTALRAKIKGGAWEDFKKFIVNFIEHDSFGKGAHIIHLIAQGIAGKKLDEWNGDNFTNRPRIIIFTAQGVKALLAGAFELDGWIYSIFHKTRYQAPQEYKRDQHSQQRIPEYFSTLVKEGLSENERDKLDGNLLDQRWRVMVRYENKLREQWPYFTYKECEPDEFSSEMMKRFVEKFEDDMDWSTYSHKEQNWNTAAAFMEVALGVASLPIAAVTGPLVGAGMALLSTVPDIIRMATANTQEESKQALNALLLGLLLDLGGEALTPVVRKGLGKIAGRKSRKLLQDISSKPHAPVIMLEDLENWAIEVRGKVKGRLDTSDAEVDDLAAWDGLDRSRPPGNHLAPYLPEHQAPASTAYRTPESQLGEANLYRLHDEAAIKDFHAGSDVDYDRLWQQAETQAEAYRLLYGSESAQAYRYYENGQQKISVKQPLPPGDRLGGLLGNGDNRAKALALMKTLESPAAAGVNSVDTLTNDLVTKLANKGIDCPTITRNSLSYDRASNTLSLSSMDNVTLMPPGTVSPTSVARMRGQIRELLEHFPQAVKAQHNLALRGGGNIALEIRNKYDNYVKILKDSQKSSQPFNAGVEQFKRDGTLAHLVGTLPHNYQMMKDTQLMNEVFTGNPLKLTPHELGGVSEFIRLARKQAEIQEVALNAMTLAYQLTPETTRLSLHPQTLLTEAAGKGSRGRCRPLAYAMEVAIHNGRSEQMLENLGRVRAQVDLGAGRRYIEALDAFHDQNLEAIETAVTVGNRASLSVSEIVGLLKKESDAASFSLRTDIHAMSVGVSVKDNGAKRYHFYDPNIGLVEYSSPEALGKGLDKTIGNKRLAEFYGADDGHYKLYRLDVAALAETPIARSPEWKIVDFSARKQPEPTKWVRTDGRLHKAPVESVCHTGRGKRSLCTKAKNYQPTPALSMASMARPSKNINDWGRDVPLFINDLQTQRVKVLFSLDDQLSFDMHTPGVARDRYLKQQLKQSDIEYVIDPKNAIEDGYTFAADADFTQPGLARDQVEQIASLVGQINTQRGANPNDVVAVHCGAGDGRSGTVKSAVMIEKLWREQPGRYRQGVVDDNKQLATIHTEISENLDAISGVDNPAYEVVADAINSVRATHLNAVERMSDVNLLNAYARFLLTHP